MNNKYSWMFLPLFLLVLTLSACRGDLDGSTLDTDGDGIPDVRDNCPLVSNPDQMDSVGNGIGDACRGDWDGDGIPDDLDDCPEDPTNTCLEDTDGDGVPDIHDNCPLVANPGQEDMNNNGIGDACDDSDGDGVVDAEDNCPFVANPDQEDTDTDGIGDACEITDPVDGDGDGVSDIGDNCPLIPNPDQADSDRDGIGDACDAEFTCKAGSGFEPMLAVNGFTASIERRGLCGLLCSGSNPERIIDGSVVDGADVSTASRLNISIGLGILNLSGISAVVQTGGALMNPTSNVDHEAGFVISNANLLLGLSLLPSLELEYFENNNRVHHVGNINLLDLKLLGLFGNSRGVFVSASVPVPYDEMRINFNTGVRLFDNYDIHAACYAD